MKSSYIHTNKNNKRTLYIYFACLVPLLLYGIYKNGILLYQKDYIGIFSVFKPLTLVAISIILNLGVEYLFNKKIELNFSYINATILALFMMPNVNIIVYSILFLIGSILFKFIDKKLHINEIAFLKLFIVLGTVLMHSYSYLNIAEANNLYAYSLLDIIGGRNTGGIATTNILLGVIIYAILSFFANYKKSIPICSYLTYVLVSLIYMLIIRNMDYTVFFQSTVILGFILVATDTLSSPYTQKGMLIYSVVLGITTAILSIWLPYDGVFIAILLLSLLSPMCDRLSRLSLKKNK